MELSLPNGYEVRPEDHNPVKQPLLSYDRSGKLKSETDIIQAITRYRDNSWRARWPRSNQNRENWDFYWGRQDYSHKMKHQSQEFLPDYPMAVEQIAGTVEQSLVDFSNWFDIETWTTHQGLLDPETMRKLLMYHLSRLYVPGNFTDSSYTFPTLVGDAVKMGLIEACINLKIYAVEQDTQRFVLEPGRRLVESAHPVTGERVRYEVDTEEVRQVVIPQVRLAIDLIPWEDFFPDPTAQNLYTIHEVSRTIADLAQNPDYDPEVIERLSSQKNWTSAGGTNPDFERRRRSGQAVVEEGALPGRVRETWGRVIDLRDGKELLPEGLVTTVGNEFLRPPSGNPFMHGRRPFISAPLVRVPLSTVHKALADHAVPMARAKNEMMNLMIDGGLASVWGIRQMRTDILENPDEVTEGVPQGYTGVLKPGTPAGEKFMERVDDGAEPQFGVDVLNRLDGAFQSALVLPDLARGVLPPRQVKATEIVQAQAASQGLYGVISSRLEDTVIAPALELCWMTLWQYIDDFTEPELVAVLGPDRALKLQTMSQAQRFVYLAQAAKFRVRGLRGLSQRAQDFSKCMTLLQSIGVNPALLQAFDMKYDVLKFLDIMVKAVNIDPTSIEKDAGQGPILDPGLLGGGAGGGQAEGAPSSGPTSPGTNGTGGLGSQIEAAMAQTNPDGFRGGQM